MGPSLDSLAELFKKLRRKDVIVYGTCTAGAALISIILIVWLQPSAEGNIFLIIVCVLLGIIVGSLFTRRKKRS